MELDDERDSGRRTQVEEYYQYPQLFETCLPFCGDGGIALGKGGGGVATKQLRL